MKIEYFSNFIENNIKMFNFTQNLNLKKIYI